MSAGAAGAEAGAGTDVGAGAGLAAGVGARLVGAVTGRWVTGTRGDADDDRVTVVTVAPDEVACTGWDGGASGLATFTGPVPATVEVAGTVAVARVLTVAGVVAVLTGAGIVVLGVGVLSVWNVPTNGVDTPPAPLTAFAGQPLPGAGT